MLFEVFRCEETDSIDRIAISQFLKVSKRGSVTRECSKNSFKELNLYDLVRSMA